MPKRELSESPSVEDAAFDLPPSVDLTKPLTSSYSYHSVIPQTLLDDEVILGVDEAGRGPVLGPLVYGIAFCSVNYSDTLKEFGFADSKTLSAQSRQSLLNTLISLSDHLAWSVRVMSPQDISAGMLKKVPYNLNAQSHDATFLLLNHVISQGVRLHHVYVDTVGPAKSYQAKLESMYPNISFTVASKADSQFPIVSAASIAAKVTRDAVIDNWSFIEPINHANANLNSNKKLKSDKNIDDDGIENDPPKNLKLGSGYPSDPNTVTWLKSNLNNIFGLPQLARFSWSTVKNLLDQSAYEITWLDERENVYIPDKNDAPSSLKKLGVQSINTF